LFLGQDLLQVSFDFRGHGSLVKELRIWRAVPALHDSSVEKGGMGFAFSPYVLNFSLAVFIILQFCNLSKLLRFFKT
jgi:hypothetical protein